MARESPTSAVEIILQRRVSAILRTHDQSLARNAMSAAVAGGFRMIEFTLTIPGAPALIAEFAKQRDLLVGAGTVLTIDDARRAVEAGAQFLVSPVCDPAVIAEARRLGVAAIPGTFTPTEMLEAHRAGAAFVKLFPSPHDVAGYVSAVLGPLPFLRIFPTAGVTPDNFVDVLQAGAAGVGFVKSLFHPEDMRAGAFASIERRAHNIMSKLESVAAVRAT